MDRYDIARELDKWFPDLEYRNAIIGLRIEKGKPITTAWLLKALVSDIEDGFITSSQALSIKDSYSLTIQNLTILYRVYNKYGAKWTE